MKCYQPATRHARLRVEYTEEGVAELLLRRSKELRKPFKEIALEAGIARSYLYRLISGAVQDPSIRTLARLARAISVSPLDLFRCFGPLQSPCIDSTCTSPATMGIGTGLLSPDDKILFLADVTIPQYTIVHAGELFRKVWRVKNVGHVPWQRRQLVRADKHYSVAQHEPNGDVAQFALPHLASLFEQVPLPEIEPGEALDIAVDFVAPRMSCSICSVWRMQTHAGALCFSRSFLLPVVVTVVAD